MKNDINKIGKEVIDLQIKALKKLRSSINNSFNQNSILNNETFHLPKKIDKKNQQFSKK